MTWYVKSPSSVNEKSLEEIAVIDSRDIKKIISMATPSVMSSQTEAVKPQSHVGFDSITTQIERKLLKRGFQFNVICVGMVLSDSI